MNTCRIIRLGAGSKIRTYNFRFTGAALYPVELYQHKPKRSPIAVGHSAARPPHILTLGGRLGFVLQRLGFRSLCCGEL